MAKVRLVGGKPLLIGGKVALTDDCCCGGVGICCIGEECSVLSEADCITAGGTFVPGISSCDPPPCILPTTFRMRCDFQGCFADKCGFTEFAGHESNPPKFYLNKLRSIGCSDGTNMQTCDVPSEWTTNYIDCSGGLQCDFSSNDSCLPLPNPCVCELHDPVPKTSTYAEWCANSSCVNVTNLGCSGTEYASVIDTLSTEFTNEDIQAIVNSLMPDYTGEFGGCIGAASFAGFSKSASQCDLRYEIERFKFKFTFDAAVSAFTIHWRYKYTPQTKDGSCNLVPGTPFYSSYFTESIGIGQTESSVHTVNEYDQDNTLTEVSDVSVTIP